MTTATARNGSTVRPAAPREGASRQPKPPRRKVADVCAGLAGLGFGVVVGLVIVSESRGALSAPGGVTMAIGRFAGFTGAYLMLVMLVLIARVPWLERSVGQDRLVRWHRKVAPWALYLIIGHVVFITIGYAQASQVGIFEQVWQFITTYADILAAVVAFGLLMLAGVTSIRIARRKLKYETWWAVHLYTYLALSLAFAHEIVTGVSFKGHPLTRLVWILVWAAAGLLVIASRIALPTIRSLRHQLRIVSVSEETPGVFSIVCKGRDIDQLAVSGGQFFQWRFLVPGLWWHSHPFSLSAMPRAPYLRVTIKALGDQSAAIVALKPGTRVAIEGPYGSFTHHSRTSDKVLLVGAGVGVTPLRALLEDLPRGVDVASIMRANTNKDLVHGAEMAALVQQHGGRQHELIGPPDAIVINAHLLAKLVPDLAERDLYVCGPEMFSDAVVHAARKLGAHSDQIHREEFSF